MYFHKTRKPINILILTQKTTTNLRANLFISNTIKCLSSLQDIQEHVRERERKTEHRTRDRDREGTTMEKNLSEEEEEDD